MQALMQALLTLKVDKLLNMVPSLNVEIINMILELKQDEEQELFQRNSSIVPIFEVDIECIAQKYSHEELDTRQDTTKRRK